MWGPHDWSLQINNNIEHQAMYSASALKKKKNSRVYINSKDLFSLTMNLQDLR